MCWLRLVLILVVMLLMLVRMMRDKKRRQTTLTMAHALSLARTLLARPCLFPRRRISATGHL